MSDDLALSLICLILLGAGDRITVVVRQTLIQVSTPDAMQVRGSGVNKVFIDVSNEAGEFEFGVTVSLWRTVAAVVAGGISTIVVVYFWASLCPALRRANDFRTLLK